MSYMSIRTFLSEAILAQASAAMQPSSSSHVEHAVAEAIPQKNKKKKKGGGRKHSDRIKKAALPGATAVETQKAAESRWLRAGNAKKKAKRKATHKTLQSKAASLVRAKVALGPKQPSVPPPSLQQPSVPPPSLQLPPWKPPPWRQPPPQRKGLPPCKPPSVYTGPLKAWVPACWPDALPPLLQPTSKACVIESVTAKLMPTRKSNRPRWTDPDVMD
jgi:hypothetical protein